MEVASEGISTLNLMANIPGKGFVDVHLPEISRQA